MKQYTFFIGKALLDSKNEIFLGCNRELPSNDLKSVTRYFLHFFVYMQIKDKIDLLKNISFFK